MHLKIFFDKLFHSVLYSLFIIYIYIYLYFKLIFIHNTIYLVQVRLHEYIDVFAAIGNTNKFTFDPMSKGHLKREHRGIKGISSSSITDSKIESVKSQRYSPLISPSRNMIDKV